MLKWFNKKRNKKGFTLIELVIVIAILGILLLIAVPRLSGFRDTAATAADKASAATIGRAAELHYATNNKTDIEIDNLISDDLIEKEGTDRFHLAYDSTDERFKVYLGDKVDEKNLLYPDPDNSGDGAED